MGETIEFQGNIEKYKDDLIKLIADAHWMYKEVARLEERIFGDIRMKVSYGVAKYGIEMCMPRGSSGCSISESLELDRREERQLKRYYELKSKVDMTDYIAGLLRNIELETIYDCLLTGMSLTEVGKHFSRDKKMIYNAREEVCDIAVKDELVVKFFEYGVVKFK